MSEYDVRRPLTTTGTNLLGLVKHLALCESRYFGEVFGRPFPEALPRWDDLAARGTDMWAAADETRHEIVGRYRRTWGLAETGRHAGHADILREQLDGSVGTIPARAKSQPSPAFWDARRSEIERIAKAASATE
ncbi:DUF664 domain-containing protein [Kribbella ginsengisoli]|uniref:DinB family protein n=1 Tax=Kribbella ginsengisoli TaxID=363865 RepID=A0ABP6Y051_9ACTN